MKQLLLYIIVSFIAFSISGQNNPSDTNDLHPLKWLQGSWKGMSNDKPFYEAWRFFNDSVLVNFEITVNNGDTVIRESNAIILKHNLKYYGNQTIQWKITRITANELVLKNDSLPYSNTIIWLHTKDDHWFAILENPASTIYYDLVKDPVIDRKVDEWIRANKR
ncbi:MAG: hypothetical protein ACXWCZ_03585 [Flavisolibacter sp.]